MQPYPKIETLYDRNDKFKVMCQANGYAEDAWRLFEFQYLKDNLWLFTEKLNGTNVRVGWDGVKMEIGGRTDEAQMPPFLLKRMQELFTPEKLQAVFPNTMVQDPEDAIAYIVTPVTLYGEGYGAKIQKGGGNYKPDGVDFALFDVLVGKWWLKWDDVRDVANKLGVGYVPGMGMGTLAEATLLAKNGIVSAFGDFPAEGFVLRPLVDLWTRKGQRVIGKIKTKDF